MGGTEAAAPWITAQCGRYPALCPEDLLKALYQSVFGCGHFVTDEAEGLCLLRRELEELPPGDGGSAVEMLGGSYCRLHLRYLAESGLAPRTLFRLFSLSAQPPRREDTALLEEGLGTLLALAEDGRLPFAHRALRQAILRWRAAGFPACRHSERFREAYAPAYRVIRREYVRLLPLLAGIDRQMAVKPQVIAALEGGSAAGKTTLAALLERIYGCNLFHMDDFFLRPEQRTEPRLAEAGGNVDRERFLEEVLLPLRRGETVLYRRYDCHTQTVEAPRPVPPGALSIVEGAYSMHPALAEFYDLSSFLRLPPALQRKRILARNDPAVQARFFSEWIPMEQAYFAATAAESRCSMILEVDG